jgi:murein tripeptide amidase MpaA
VVPIVNIDGRKQIEVLGNYNLRKNPNGVDLNRNW